MPTSRLLPAALALLAIFVIEGVFFIKTNSQTSDEAVHLAAGYSYVARHDFRLNPEHPPLVKELSGLAVWLIYRLPFEPPEALWRSAEEWHIGRDFLYSSAVSWDRILFTGRIPNLVLGTLLIGLVGWWAFRLWGEGAALLATALAAFEPNLIANSGLITTDVGGALFSFLAVYLLWEYGASPSWKLLAGVGIATGLALVSKYSSVILIPILCALILSGPFIGDRFPLPGRGGNASGRKAPAPIEALPFGLAILALSAAVIPLAYFLQGPSTWWLGLQRVLTHQEAGHQAFFLGEYSTQGWWSYFPVAFLIKTPVGTLVAILLSLVLYRRGLPPTRREAVYLLLPVAILFASAAWGKINIGLRHMLPAYPFLIVVASRLATVSIGRGPGRRLLAGLPVVVTALSSLRVAPHQLAYFNELVGGPPAGYRYLSDSNLDWGQDLEGVKEYMDRNRIPMIYLSYFGNAPPGALGIRYQYVPAFGHLDRAPADALPEDAPREILAISVCSLQAVHFQDKNLYRWLLGRAPLARIGYSIYIYDLTGDPEAHLRLAEIYLKLGPRSLAEPELRRVLARDPANAEAKGLLDLLRSSSGNR